MNKYISACYIQAICFLYKHMLQCFRQPATKTLVTIKQKETSKSIWSTALLKKPRFHGFIFFSNLFPPRDPATPILPQQLKLESSISLDLFISLIPRSQSTPTSVAFGQIHPVTVSLPPSRSSSLTSLHGDWAAQVIPEITLSSQAIHHSAGLPKHGSDHADPLLTKKS